jgi:hypothetical protein
MAKAPFNIALLDVDKMIRDEKLLPVTSPFIREPSTNTFHPEGLFSEQIFGPIISPMRKTRFAYIDLNCQVFHPIIFQNLRSLRSFYVDIIAGKEFAIWNDDHHEFDPADESDEGADTGFTFFLNHFRQLKFTRNASLKRSDKIGVMEKYKDLLLITKYPVIPAGLRDVQITDSRMEKDEINNLYMGLLNVCKAMPPTGAHKAIYDSIHYAIQRKVNEIHQYIMDMVSGKRGYLEGKYGARSLALGTRNVIAASIMVAPNAQHPQYHKVDESKVPLFQAAKGFQPLVIYALKHFFFNLILDNASDQVSVIDPITHNLIYRPIDEMEKNKWLTSEGLGKFITLFEDADIRFRPLVFEDEDHKFFYPYMVYDEGDRIYLVRDVPAFKNDFAKEQKQFDESKLRPITNCEVLYIATYIATIGKHGTVTRYPVTDEQSIYVSKCHLMSTIPSRTVQLTPYGAAPIVLPEYPISTEPMCDALMLHPSRMKRLGGD